MITYEKMQEVVNEAKTASDAINQHVKAMVQLIVGRLSKPYQDYEYKENLAKLKKELNNFNSVTGRWKS
jgi:glutamyl-tRNA reductase